MSSIVLILFMIPILTIGTGIYVYNSASSTIDDAASKMEEQEVSVYNSSVSSYIGTSKKGVDVKSLIDSIIASNQNNVGDAGKFIALTLNGETIGIPGDTLNSSEVVSQATTEMTSAKSTINMGKRYTIEADYDTAGRIIEMKVTEEA